MIEIGGMDITSLPYTPQRVVSLIPSLTESLFELGLGNYLVGITDYCKFPLGKLDHLVRVGGVKDARIKDIINLNPDLVIVNQEENSKMLVEDLQSVGISVWVTFPKTVKQSLEILWKLLEIYHHRMGMASLRTIELTLEWVNSSREGKKSIRYFCPIWFEQRKGIMNWWMTFNHQTYSEDLLNYFKYENVFSHRERYYPLEADLGLVEPEENQLRDHRYPRVTLSEIIDSQPEVIILPDEPFPFDVSYQNLFYQIFKETPAAREKRIIVIDGSLITWYGTRLAHALRDIPPLLDSL